MNDKDGPKGLHKGAPVSHDTVENERGKDEDGKDFPSYKQRTRQNSAENILKDGMCFACCRNEPINCSEIVKCFFCRSNFHAINCLDSCNVSATTAFTNHLSHAINKTSSYDKRFGQFFFMCNDCVTLNEKRLAESTSDRVELLESKIDSIKQEFREELSELKSILKQQLREQATNSNHNSGVESITAEPPVAVQHPKPVLEKKLYSQCVENLKHVVTVKNQVDGSQVSRDKLEKTCISNGIAVVKTFSLQKSKETGIVCNSRKDAEKLMQSIGEKLPEHKTELLSARMPEVNIVGLTREYSSEDLQEMIVKQNNGISELFKSDSATDDDKKIKIISVTPLKSYKGNQSTPYKATVRISNVIREIMAKQGNRLFLGSHTCKVYDSFYVVRCFKCQRFGHLSKSCTQEHASCGYCTEEHETTTCPKKVDASSNPSCINCISSGRKGEEVNHYAGSITCPILLEKQNELKKRIPFYRQNM